MSGVILFVYLTKKNIHKSNNGFGYTALTLIILSIIGFIYPYTITIMDSQPQLNELVCRSYALFTYLFAIELLTIIILATCRDSEIIKKPAFYTTLLIGSIIISFLLSALLPIDYGVSGIYVITGPAVKYTYALIIPFHIVEIVLLINERKKHRNINPLPYIAITVLYYAVMIYLFITDTAYNIGPVFYAAFMVVLYLTFENQDSELLVEYNRAKVNAENSSESKTTLLSYVYHEIRTELSVINNYSDLIGGSEKIDDDEYNDALISVNESLNNLNTIMNTMKTYNILENAILIENKNYSLEDLINGLKNIYSFNLSYDENLPKHFYGDLKLILEIVSFITQSIKKISPGEEVFIRIGGVTEGYKCTLEINLNTVNRIINKEKFEQNYRQLSLVQASKNYVDLFLINAGNLARKLGGTITFDDINGNKFAVRVVQDVINVVRKDGE